MDLRGLDVALDERPAVVLESSLDAGAELPDVARLREADRGALVPRLHDDREAEASVELGERVFQQVLLGRHVVRRGRNVVETEHLLGLELVHRERRGKHRGARVRDPHELEHSLDAAVLTATPVEGEEGDVDLGVPDGAVDRIRTDDHTRDLVAACLECAGDAFAGPERDVSLRARAAHQYPHAPLLHLSSLAVAVWQFQVSRHLLEPLIHARTIDESSETRSGGVSGWTREALVGPRKQRSRLTYGNEGQAANFLVSRCPRPDS